MISWTTSDWMEAVLETFKAFCNLPSIHGVIDNAHFLISKHVGQFSHDYFYHKSRDYYVICQVVVDHIMQIHGHFYWSPKLCE
jgi:hypothetical protein